jgi:hypothetical protein
MNDVRAVGAMGLPRPAGGQTGWPPARALGPPTAFRTFLVSSRDEAMHDPLPATGRSAAPLAHTPRPRGSLSPAEQPVRPEPAKPEEDSIDPIHRRRVALAPPEISNPSLVPVVASAPFHVPPAADPAPKVRAAASLEDLIPSLVRRIAWSGDRHRGSVRLELGTGELAGATLLVHAEGGRVRVQMNVPAHVNADEWQERLRRRLAARKIATDAVEVT